jgi:hypothetical protein
MDAIGLAAFGCRGIGAIRLAAERFVRRRAGRNWPLVMYSNYPQLSPAELGAYASGPAGFARAPSRRQTV